MKKHIIAILGAATAIVAAAETPITYRWWFDAQENEEQTFVGGIEVARTLDVSGLVDGVHTVSLQIIAPELSSPAMRYFMKYTITQGENNNQLKCYYSLDGGALVATTDPGYGTYSTELDVSALGEGLHQFTYYIDSEHNGVQSLATRYFYIGAFDECEVTGYEYWVNDAHYSVKMAQSVKVPGKIAQNVAVPVCPIRSSKFHFERNAKGEPEIYAIDDFSILFNTSAGKTDPQEATFIDPRTATKVAGTKLDKPQGEIAMAAPRNDAIAWHYVKAAAGDHLALRADGACTLQIFSPTDALIYEAAGDDAMAGFEGALAENGDYYIAVHDAEDGIESLTLAYEHQSANTYVKGDANGDGIVTVGDITATVNHIIGVAGAGFVFAAADVNEDGEISIGDVTGIVNLILEGASANPMPRLMPMLQIAAQTRLSASAIAIDGNSGHCTLSINEPDKYSALQFDVALPEGIEIESMRLAGANAESHVVAYAMTGWRSARAILYSLDNSKLSGNEVVELTFAIDADKVDMEQSVVVSGALVDYVAADNSVVETKAAGCMASMISGIADVEAEGLQAYAQGRTLIVIAPHDCNVTVATASGISFTLEAREGINAYEIAEPGVYFVGNKKLKF